jgi:hypothetical protein
LAFCNDNIIIKVILLRHIDRFLFKLYAAFFEKKNSGKLRFQSAHNILMGHGFYTMLSKNRENTHALCIMNYIENYELIENLILKLILNIKYVDSQNYSIMVFWLNFGRYKSNIQIVSVDIQKLVIFALATKLH